MGMARLEQQYHQDRLRYPLRRIGARGEGRWQRISWNEAFDLLAGRLANIAEQYGSRSLAFFAGSGAAGVLTKGSAQRFAAAIGGTAYRAGGIDYGVPKGLEYMFGVPASTFFRPGGHEMADAINSRMILLWGGNGADTRLVDFHFVTAAQQRGAKLVCIDPNRSATAQRADQWISPRPGTDVRWRSPCSMKFCRTAGKTMGSCGGTPTRRCWSGVTAVPSYARRTYSAATLRIIWYGIRPENARRRTLTATHPRCTATIE